MHIQQLVIVIAFLFGFFLLLTDSYLKFLIPFNKFSLSIALILI